MRDSEPGEMELLIKWKDSYDTNVLLIDQQHMGILQFINQWHEELKGKSEPEELAGYIKRKFDFLVKFSRGHLRFESEMLRLLTQRYGFPDNEYRLHLEKHSWFLKSFLLPLGDRLSSNQALRRHDQLAGLAREGLMETARWWYDHIRSPLEGEKPSPDHIYRLYLEALPPETRLEILNQMMVYMARHDNNHWLGDIQSQAD